MSIFSWSLRTEVTDSDWCSRRKMTSSSLFLSKLLEGMALQGEWPERKRHKARPQWGTGPGVTVARRGEQLVRTGQSPRRWVLGKGRRMDGAVTDGFENQEK